MCEMHLPSGAHRIIAMLEAAGHTAYVVGGAVRDTLLGRPVGDIDITTSASPAEMKSIFGSLRTFDTGIEHGTLTVLADGMPYEVTTYRIDGEYLDARHPSGVVFTDKIELDLGRRDFTVNAICYNPSSGYLDPYSGRADAEAGVIRAVGDPRVRFDEDALRILRALRFSSVLGFRIAPDTAAAIREKHSQLSHVSRERVYVEIKKLLGGVGALDVLSEYREIVLGVLPPLTELVLPEQPVGCECDWLTLLLSVFALSSSAPAEDFAVCMHSLRSDNRTRSLGVATLSALAADSHGTDDTELLRLLRAFGEAAVRRMLSVRSVLGLPTADPSRVDLVIASGRPYCLRMLAVNGNDLASLGVRGPEIGDMLELALTEVIEGNVANDRDALLGLVRSRREG